MSVIFEKVREIIVEQFEKDPIDVTMEKSLVEDLELDSLDLFDLICALEKEYGFHFEREMGSSMGTIGEIVAELEAHAVKK